MECLSISVKCNSSLKITVLGGPGELQPVSLTVIPREILEPIMKQSIYKQLKDNMLIRNYQQGIWKNKSCQTKLISLFD